MLPSTLSVQPSGCTSGTNEKKLASGSRVAVLSTCSTSHVTMLLPPLLLLLTLTAMITVDGAPASLWASSGSVASATNEHVSSDAQSAVMVGVRFRRFGLALVTFGLRNPPQPFEHAECIKNCAQLSAYSINKCGCLHATRGG